MKTIQEIVKEIEVKFNATKVEDQQTLYSLKLEQKNFFFSEMESAKKIMLDLFTKALTEVLEDIVPEEKTQYDPSPRYVKGFDRWGEDYAEQDVSQTQAFNKCRSEALENIKKIKGENTITRLKSYFEKI